MELPVGTITFLLTDIEGSTRLWAEQPELMAPCVARHDALLTEAITANHGAIVRTRGEGDSFFAVFDRATDAVAAARDIQRALVAEPWSGGIVIRTRIGMNTGEAELRDGDYYGSAINRCARIRAIGHGGQALLSQATSELVRDELPENVSLRDLGLHRLKDLQRPEQVYQILHPDLPHEFPRLNSLDALPNNLPLQLTSFVGRQREMEQVRNLLAETHMLTLAGAGGLGKTRLALQVAAEVADGYPGGVWLVELGTLPAGADVSLVAQELLRALSLRAPAGRTPIETLCDHLRAARALIILDNCEHVITASATLAEALLRACPEVRLLATSREVLAVPGEIVWRVPPLAVSAAPSSWMTHLRWVPPPDREYTSLEPGAPRSSGREAPLPSQEPGAGSQEPTYDEAVRLFVERATASQPRFALTPQNAATVAQICVRLDGLPLAIELAAARVKVLAVEQIASRLDDVFRLLTGGSRTALPRQQTLRALIDWSFDLLSERERTLMARLPVFAGGFTLEAVMAICSDPDMDEYEVLDLLGQLVDKSLVIADELPGEVRYRLLETIRQYAREHTVQSGEEAELRARHRDWYLEFAERTEPELLGSAPEGALALLEREHDNLRAALASIQAPDEADQGLRLVGALWRFWAMRGYLAEGREQMARVLALVEAGSSPTVCSPVDHAKVLHGAALLAHWQGDYEAARSLGESGLAIRRELGDRQQIADSLNNLGGIAVDLGDLAAARSLYEESLALRRELGDQQGIANSLHWLGNVTSDQGDAVTARGLYEESLAIRRRIGNQPGIADSLNCLGVLADQAGEPERAQALFEESLAIRRQLGIKRGVAVCLANLGNAAHALGDFDAAQSRHEESLALFRELGDRAHTAVQLVNLGTVASDRGDDERARTAWRECLGLFHELQNPPLALVCLEGLARLAARRGHRERAARLFAAVGALQDSAGPDDPTGEPRAESREPERSELQSAFPAAWAEGEAMTLEQAIAHALV
jgi:predicted ATPase/class 3 adenylate cyclase